MFDKIVCAVVGFIVGCFFVHFSREALPIIAPPLEMPKIEVSQRERGCIEEALWYEARSETVIGIAAVMSVIENRKMHPDYPKTYCGVVYQSMQFSYRNNVRPGIELKPIPKSVFEPKAAIISEIAEQAASGKFQKVLPDTVLYYTTTKVFPAWAKNLKVHVTIDNHRFYEGK